MDTIKRYCMGCLSPMKGDGAVCSICSHDNSIDNPRGTLPAGTVLEGRYLVGAVRSQNDLTIVYIGLDLERGRRVYVEEFMPRAQISVPMQTGARTASPLPPPAKTRLNIKRCFPISGSGGSLWAASKTSA